MTKEDRVILNTIKELLQKIYEQMVEQNKFVESRLNDIVTNTRRKTG